MKLGKGDICVAKVAVPGNWPLWYLASIEAYEEDAEGNWSVDSFRVVGEAFVRDTHGGLYVIRDEVRQKQAGKLAKLTWTPKGYNTLDEVRGAITEVWL